MGLLLKKLWFCVTVCLAAYIMLAVWEYENDIEIVEVENDETETELHTEFYRIDTDPEKTENLPFLPNYKNPCWRELYVNRSDTHIRCLPYFYLVGAPKCGTTDLNKRLTEHPLISAHVPKEPHWIGRFQYYENTSTGMLSDYLAIFDEAVEKDITRIQLNGYFNSIFGDCSASTLWSNSRLIKNLKRNKNEVRPNWTNADTIFHLNPNTKIIIIIRNPIARLYSEYLYFNTNQTKEDFHSRVLYSLARYKSCKKYHSEQYCVYKNDGKTRVRIGLYYIFIKDFMRVFPKEQMKIIKLESHSKNINESMNSVFAFLGLDPPSIKEMKQINTEKKANENTMMRISIGEMLPKTYNLLYEFYKPYNKRLVQLLGQDFDYN